MYKLQMPDRHDGGPVTHVSGRSSIYWDIFSITQTNRYWTDRKSCIWNSWFSSNPLCKLISFLADDETERRPAAMTVSAPISCNCSSVAVVQSSSSTWAAGVVCSLSPFSWTLVLSFCRTLGWQSLKKNLFGLQERQMVIPVSPTPLPSSRTVLQTRGGGGGGKTAECKCRIPDSCLTTRTMSHQRDIFIFGVLVVHYVKLTLSIYQNWKGKLTSLYINKLHLSALLQLIE